MEQPRIFGPGGEGAARGRHSERIFVDERYVEGTGSGLEKLTAEYEQTQRQLEGLESDLQKGIDASLQVTNPKMKELHLTIGRGLTAQITELKEKRDALGKRILEMGGTLETEQ